jgi:hypothetical protein
LTSIAARHPKKNSPISARSKTGCDPRSAIAFHCPAMAPHQASARRVSSEDPHRRYSEKKR